MDRKGRTKERDRLEEGRGKKVKGKLRGEERRKGEERQRGGGDREEGRRGTERRKGERGRGEG